MFFMLLLKWCCPNLVYEIQSHSSLPDLHFFWLPVFSILGTNAIHTLLQPSSSLIFLPVLLPLSTHTYTQCCSNPVKLVKYKHRNMFMVKFRLEGVPWSWSLDSTWCTWWSPGCSQSKKPARSPCCHGEPPSILSLEEVEESLSP